LTDSALYTASYAFCYAAGTCLNMFT